MSRVSKCGFSVTCVWTSGNRDVPIRRGHLAIPFRTVGVKEVMLLHSIVYSNKRGASVS